MPDAGEPIIHPGVDTSGKPPPRRRRARAEPPATTWWATRFLAAIAAAAGRGRLSRGLEYARAGRVDDLTIEPGHASAQVLGSRPTPYRAALRLAPFGDALWARAIARMGEDAAASAALAAGQLPEGVEAAFAELDASLFPSPDERVAAACTCPDAVRPCKHAAALVYALVSRFDKDPFVLLALRGKGREELLAALRVSRKRAALRERAIATGATAAASAAAAGGPTMPLPAAAREPTGAAPGPPPPAAAAGRPLPAVHANGPSAPPAADLPTDPTRFWASPAEPDLPPAGDPGDTLKRLGLPPRALGGVELKMELALAYRILAERAGKALKAD